MHKLTALAAPAGLVLAGCSDKDPVGPAENRAGKPTVSAACRTAKASGTTRGAERGRLNGAQLQSIAGEALIR